MTEGDTSFELFFKLASEGMILIHRGTSIITRANPAFVRLLEYSEEGDIVGRKWEEFIHDNDLQENQAEILRNPDKIIHALVNRYKTKTGNYVWISWTTAPTQDGQVICAIARDITEFKVREEKLFKLAHYDNLTGLANRQLLIDRFHMAAAQATREKLKVGLIFIDLNKFKVVNDTYGHASGDMMLIEISKRMKYVVRDTDTVSRFGGDEFVILLPLIKESKGLRTVCARLMIELMKPVRLASASIKVGGACGYSMFPDDGDRWEGLLKLADHRMYQDKENFK